jgi:hypothetical protein
MICGVFKHLGAAVKRHQTPSLATISFRLRKRKGKRWSVAKQKEASMRIHDRSIHAVVGERDADSSSALNYLLISTLSIIVPHFAPDPWGFGWVDDHRFWAVLPGTAMSGWNRDRVAGYHGKL